MDIDINRIATLARLQLSEEEKVNYSKQLASILSLAAQMDQFPTKNISAMAHPLETAQPLREDRVEDNGQRDVLQRIAPRVAAGLYLVPQVIDDEK